MTPIHWTMFWLMAAGSFCILWERRARFGAPEVWVERDVKRETQYLGQYGQFSCLAVACAVILAMSRLRDWHAAVALAVASVLTLAITHSAKRFFGRIRPGRERDGHVRGAFLGPTWRRLSWRESFPSSHAAGAFAMSTVLWHFYPEGAWVWWTLAVVASFIRWLIDAHWLSDVLVGGVFGIACGLLAVMAIGWVG
jgi:membrane-associated phospholipid phosphatase